MIVLRDIFHNATGTHAAMAVEAPTGSGKTMTAYEHFRDEAGIMVLPTRMAIENVRKRHPCHGRLRLLTPIPAIEQMTRGVPPLVIVDEAHTSSREYESLLCFLRRMARPPRLLFLSALIDEERLSGFFPGLVVARLPAARKHPIAITYHTPLYDRVPSSYALIQEIDHVMRLRVMTLPERERTKILCFVASHEQCDRLADATKHQGYEVHTLHGGMSEEEVGEIRDRLADPDIMTICFATNMVETAVTLPGLQVVIDSGIRTNIQGGHRLVQEWCDRSSMIQRAGRTGRTCPGRVIRLMSEQRYGQLPLVHLPVHNFEPVVLFFLSRGIDPEKVLGADKTTPCLDKFREMGIEHGYDFLARCGVDVEVGLPAYRFSRSRRGDGATTAVCLALAIIQMYRNQPMNWVYIDKKYRLARERALIMKSIRDTFCVDGDMLGSVVGVFTAIWCAERPVEFCKRNSFNFRCFRETKRVFVRLASVVSSSPKPSLLARTVTRDLWTAHQETVLRFLWRWFPRFDTRREVADGPGYLDQRFCSLHLHRTSTVSLLELVRKTDDNITLWTRYPLRDYREEHWMLARTMELRRERMNQRLAWRAEFDAVVAEIRDEVAFRPGMCGMEGAMADFFSYRR
ncbi:hypothetical protein EBZ80_01050 [bacterium]|nr:hypothetical protein [bacterium]